MDLISVIVPVYNSDKYLRTCLESIAGQTYSNLEVILVDDDSTDKSGAICDDFVSRDSRFEVIHKRDNGGPARARNAGIRRAKGKYIVFIDGDDYVKKTFIERLHDAILKTEAEIAVCGYVSDGVKHGAPAGNLSGLAATLRLLTKQENSDIVVWNKMYLASLFRNVRFADTKVYEDNLTTYKYYAAAKKVCYIIPALYYYTIREDSLMARTPTFEHLSARLKAAREAQKYFSARDPKLRQAAEFSEVLAEFAFIDKALEGALPFKEFYKHRTRALKLAPKSRSNPYTSTRVKWYLRMLRPFGGWPYRFFRHLVS